MGNQLALRLVPDDLWEAVESLIPPPKTRPQGGGRSRVDNRAVFTAITYVLTSGCSWRRIPPVFGVAISTTHRRFREWTSIGLWERIHVEARDRFGNGREVCWTEALVENAAARAGEVMMDQAA